MPVSIQVEVKPEVAEALHKRGSSTPAAERLLETVEGLGVELRPSYPGVNDPLLATQFTVQAPDQASAERIQSRLRRFTSAVEAAYVEPPPAPP